MAAGIVVPLRDSRTLMDSTSWNRRGGRGILDRMSDLTQVLSRIEHGDRSAANELLPLVYRELRELAAAKLARESPGHTLQPTALVHEAYLRLVGTSDRKPAWDGRGHFFSAAAEAMRRILVENARRKLADKRGAGKKRIELEDDCVVFEDRAAELVAVHDVLDQLAAEDPSAAEVVKMRYFASMTMDEVAAVLGISRRQAQYQWAFAKAWLHHALRSD